jgi:hypothetical protein
MQESREGDGAAAICRRYDATTLAPLVVGRNAPRHNFDQLIS